MPSNNVESLIARFAEEGDDSAISALGRIASASSRRYLKDLYRTSDERRRSLIVQMFAHFGHAADAGFLVDVLTNC